MIRYDVRSPRADDFINHQEILDTLAYAAMHRHDAALARSILEKARANLTPAHDHGTTLTHREASVLLACEDPEVNAEIRQLARDIKQAYYGNRIVLFAPLYLSNYCVNGCLYCPYHAKNRDIPRRKLTQEEIRAEVIALQDMGHKRLAIEAGEDPAHNPLSYILESLETIYGTKYKNGAIRRVNVNIAATTEDAYRQLKAAEIGTYILFQETYHRGRYAELHPANTVKGNYRWRLYAMHRAMEAGVDDVAIGALFGLYDWKFEVMGLVHHAWDLEKHFGIGPHTVSFPRMQPAPGSFLSEHSPYIVSDEAMKRVVAVLRLAIPYSGLIVTARENPVLKRELINHYGCTQTDASSKLGIGAYAKKLKQEENPDKVQFMLGDQRSLDEVIRELANDGMITSFCTAGYRCGRTGDKIMNLLEKGVEGKFCKLNAVLTFREYLNDYASPETREVGEKLIARELQEIESMPFFTDKKLLPTFRSYYDRIARGERDLYM